MRVRSALAASLAALMLACSAPPTKERDQADGALAAARAAEAAVYAPAELRAAEAALQRYDAAVAQRDYRLALSLALEARENAYEAARRAGDEKATARSQAERLIADLEPLVAAANGRLNGPASSRPSAAAADRLRDAIKDAPTALQEARTLLDKHDYAAAIARLTPVVGVLRKETEPSTPATGRRGR
jgi:hypothetical protein